MSEPATKNPFAVPTIETAPAAIPAPSTPAPQPAPIAGPIPTETRAIGLLIRRAVDEATQALAATGPARSARLDATARRMTAALVDATELSRLERIEWAELVPDLASLARGARELLASLISMDTLADGVELTTALDHFSQRVDKGVWKDVSVANPGAVKPITAADQFELAHATIAATRKQVTLVRAQMKNETDAVALSTPLHLHLAQAIDATLRVDDRQQRLRLTAEITELSSDMQALGQLLSMAPKLRWHLEFASAFDAENQLRAAVGMDLIDRPYSGTVDPSAALDHARSMADNAKYGTAEDAVATPATDPQTAVQLIRDQLIDGAYTSQYHAVTAFHDAIEVSWPASSSWLETLTEFVLKAALDMISDGIAGKVESMLAKTLAQRAMNSVAGSIPTHLAGEERHKAFEKAIEISATTRTGHAKRVNSGVKKLLGVGVQAGLDAGKSHKLIAVDALNCLVESLHASISASRLAADKEMIVLAPALAQLDVEVLNSLVTQMYDLPKAAAAATTNAVMVQWQNLKVANARPGSPWDEPRSDPDLDAPKSGPFGDEPIAGVLEVGLRVAPKLELAYLVLRDGEPTAVNHFKGLKLPIAQLGLNRQYQISFDGYMSAKPDMWPAKMNLSLKPATYVKLGVGAHDGLQVETLSRAELLMLKIYRAGAIPDVATLIDEELTHRFDQISDADAIETAKSLIRTIDNTTTSDRMEH